MCADVAVSVALPLVKPSDVRVARLRGRIRDLKGLDARLGRRIKGMGWGSVGNEEYFIDPKRMVIARMRVQIRIRELRQKRDGTFVPVGTKFFASGSSWAVVEQPLAQGVYVIGDGVRTTSVSASTLIRILKQQRNAQGGM